ncbi:MAG: hypothetical protein HW408_1406, partial [Actinobacteria bacterium]|nr:hypothetical protein [Actinomycetota bacterium]
MDILREAREKLEEEAQRIEVELRVKLPKEIAANKTYLDMAKGAATKEA